MIDSAVQAIIELSASLLALDDGALNPEQQAMIAEIHNAAASFPQPMPDDAHPDPATCHRMRGRVSTILGFAGLLLEDPEGPLTNQQLEKIRQINDLGQQVLQWLNTIDRLIGRNANCDAHLANKGLKPLVQPRFSIFLHTRGLPNAVRLLQPSGLPLPAVSPRMW
jgi:hypothetical protein